MKKRILYIILGVMLLSVKGVGQTITLDLGFGLTNCDFANVTVDRGIYTTANFFKIYGSNDGGTTFTVAPPSSSSISSATATAQLFTTGFYIVKFYNNTTLLGQSSTSSSVHVIINPLPSASISGSAIVCKDAIQPSITFTGSNATAPYAFTYSINGGSSQTITTTSGNTVSVPAPTGTSGIFSYVISNVRESSSTACSNTASGTESITVNSLPLVTFQAAANLQECQSNALTYTTQSGKTNYQWTPSGILNTDYVITNGGLSVNDNTVTLKWLTTGFKTLQVNYFDANGCTAALSTNSNTTINPLPNASISGTAIVCKEATQPLVIFTGSNATAPYSFTYSINGGSSQTVSTTSGNSVTVPVSTNTAGSFSYVISSVQESSVAACSNTASGTSSITVNPLPTVYATVTPLSGAICKGSNATLTGVGASTYTYTGGVANATPFAPTTTTTYIITGTDANGCVSTGTYTVTVNTLPIITASSVETSGILSNDGIVCTGASIKLLGSGAVSYVWDNSITNNTSFVPVVNTTYTATGTDANGCVNTGTYTVTVNSLPTKPTITSSTICEGMTATITGPTGVYTYTWQVPTGIATSTTRTLSTTKAGTYSLTITDANSCVSEVGTARVTVNPLPPKPTLTSSIICEGQTATITGPSGVYTYTWQVPTGLATTTTKNLTTTKAGTYSLTITDANSCVSEVGTGTVVVNALPPKPTLTSPVICEGATATITGPTGVYTYTWQVPTGVATSTTETISTSKAGTYSLTITDANSCISEVGTGTVVVNALPPRPTLTSPVICEGETATVTMSTPTGASTYTYTWTVPTGVATSTTKTVSTSKAGTYSLTIMDANSCTSEVGTGTVVVNALPPKPTLTSPVICEGETATVTMLTPTGTSTYTYTWQVPTGVATSTTKTVNTTKAGTYSLSITNDKGCTSAGASGTVTVNPIPAVPIISSNSPICEGASLNLITTNVSGATYSWTGPNSYTSSLINPIINNANSLAAGNYSLKITTNGCSSPLSTPINVIINATPTAPTVSSNSPIEEEKTLNLTASTLTGASYAWSGPNGFASIQQNPSITGATPANSGKYYATVTLNGCTSVSSLPINVLVNAKVLSSPVFQIPNAFTPNSDGHNDTFKIIENGYVTSIIGFKIFTKSGKLIFSDKDGAWDGRYAGVMLDSDVYIWIADFMNKNNIQEHLSGTVLLLK